MYAFQSKYGGACWVVVAYDDWIYGTDRQPDPNGGWVCPESFIAQAIANLTPAERPDKTRVTLGVPTMRPAAYQKRRATADDCRRANETLWLEIWASMCVDGVATRDKMLIGRVPQMVGSMSEDRVFDAGYFVIDGIERVFVNREARRFDVPRYYVDNGSYCVDVMSIDCPLTLALKQRTIVARLPYKTDVEFSLMDLLRALGLVESNPFPELEFEDISLRDAEQKLGKAFQNNMGGTSAARIRTAARHVLDYAMLPFLKPEEKTEFLIRIAHELMRFANGERLETDVDAMENKRVDTAGRYIARHACRGIREMWRKACIKLQSASIASDPQKHIQANQVENVILSAMLSGSDIDDRATTILPRRASWWEGVAVCRRVTANVAAESYVIGPRLLHGTWMGFYCACETQEGEKTGLNRETAMFFRTSPIGKPAAWRSALETAPMGFGTSRVLINGSIARRNVDAVQAKQWCMEHKRVCDTYAGVFSEGVDVCIDVSEGRALRPVWVGTHDVDHWADFDACVAQGRIMWIDANMVLEMCIATERTNIQPWHTHVELHPMAYLGPSAANIPFLDHNPGARNLFGAHVRHQAVGESVPFAKWQNGTHDRFNTKEINRLWHTQRAMCDTELARTMKSHEIPGGWNAVIFVLADARGQEDAIGISERHIDLGAAVSETEISFKDVLGTDESFGVADVADPKFSKLDADGLPWIGATIREGDVLIAKKRHGRDASTVIWSHKHGCRVRAVSRVGDDVACVRISFTRWPDIGDKFATRHGQKGVMNFGITHNNTLWTSDGVSPDLVLSPACLPSRMTIGNLFEMLCGKKTALCPPNTWSLNGCGGTDADCSPYSETFDYASVQAALRSLGYQPKGHETVYSAKTGRVLDNASVFVGPAFVQRLTHFAMPKCYARGRGVVNPQTGQPPKGRSHDGGLKLGEMETKAQQAYGAAATLQTTYLDCSDGIEVGFCLQCEDVRGFDLDKKCVICKSKRREKRKAPRSFMLMIDELKIAKIHVKLI